MRFRIGRGVVGDCPECERDRARAWRRVPDRHHRTPRMCVLLPPVNSPAVVTAALTWCRDGWEAGCLDSCNPEEPHRCPGPPDEDHPEGTPGDESRPMCDTAVSPQIASPEMWLGRCIGLETDIYAFGIVMWEVITRRQAWHWFQRESSTSNTIAMRIEEAVSSIDGGGLGKRPRMPLGLKKKPAQYMRFCMHELPSERPSAKELKAWLESQRRELDQFMQEQKRKKVREVDMKTDAHRLQNMCFATITDRQHVESRDCWSEGGRYSLSRSSKLAAGRMKLTVTEETEDQWMEMALTAADEDEPTTPRSVRHTRKDPTKQPNVPREKFGIVFKAREINHWPKVLRVDQRDSKTGRPTAASHFPFIRSGAKLVKINDMDVPRTFSEALPMLKALPLTLEFDCAVDEAEMTVPEWRRAGLEEIGLVHRHEMRTLKARCSEGCELSLGLVKKLSHAQLHVMTRKEDVNLRNELQKRTAELKQKDDEVRALRAQLARFQRERGEEDERSAAAPTSAGLVDASVVPLRQRGLDRP
jgi:hypothetical protein